MVHQEFMLLPFQCHENIKLNREDTGPNSLAEFWKEAEPLIGRRWPQMLGGSR